MALVKCKECGTEISNTVTTCPKCGFVSKKPQGCLQQGVKVIFGGFMCLIILGMAMSMCSKRPNADGTPVSASGSKSGSGAEANPDAHTSYKVGDTIKTAKFEITVTKMELRDSVGKEPFLSKPADGGVYVTIQWRYKNISDKPVGTFSMPSLHLIDPKQTKYSRDTGASSSYATELDLTHKVFSDLNPGISVTAASVFEVSKDSFDSKTWSFVIEADKKVQVSF